MSTGISDYLNSQFLKWQQDSGKRQTLRAFSEYLKVSYTALNGWINGVHPPDAKNIGRIAEVLGPDIYDVVGMPRPSYSVSSPALDRLPREVRSRLQAALQEIDAQLDEHGVDPDSPDGLVITADVMERYGFTLKSIRK